MSCNCNQLCNNLIISSDVTFAGTTLAINIPAGSYSTCRSYALVIAQPLPATTTISANVVITIGEDATTYPLVNCDGTNVNAYQLGYRTVYPVKVRTNVQSGVFQLQNRMGCKNYSGNASALPIPAAE